MKKIIVTGGRAQNRMQLGLAAMMAAGLNVSEVHTLTRERHTRPTRAEHGGRGSAKTPPKAHYDHHSGNRENARRLKQLAKQEAKKS